MLKIIGFFRNGYVIGKQVAELSGSWILNSTFCLSKVHNFFLEDNRFSTVVFQCIYFFGFSFHNVVVNFRFSVPSSVSTFFFSGQSIGFWPSYGLVTMECQSQGKIFEPKDQQSCLSSFLYHHQDRISKVRKLILTVSKFVFGWSK